MQQEDGSPTSSIKLIWEPELCEQLGRSRYTLQRWVREGRFPPPIKVNQQNLAWRVRDVEAWLDKLARSRKKRTPRGALMQGSELVEQT
jgi:prophage regulatory protein